MSEGVSLPVGLGQRLLSMGFGCSLLVLAACHHEEAGSADQGAAQTFRAVCAKCHGTDGKGGVPAMEGAAPPRNFCDAAFQTSRTDEQIKQVIQKGKGGMPAFGSLFPEADLQALVHKIRSFDPAKGH
ncbi:MAG: cytochrome c [Polyangiaceae bacterium]